jgi:hypothetical protein
MKTTSAWRPRTGGSQHEEPAERPQKKILTAKGENSIGFDQFRLRGLRTDLVQRQHREFETIARACLGEDALQVTLHGVFADCEFAGNVLVLISASHQERNLAFAFTEPRKVRGRRLGFGGHRIKYAPCDFIGEGEFAVGNSANGGEKLNRVIALQDKPRGRPIARLVRNPADFQIQ